MNSRNVPIARCTRLCIGLIENPIRLSSVFCRKFAKPVTKKPTTPIVM
jgi:hypothetical protein